MPLKINSEKPMTPINRRYVLKGAGATLALPFLPSLYSKDNSLKKQVKVPKRLVFLNFGYGTSHEFYPDTNLGDKFKLTERMSPLENIQKDISFISNLSNLSSFGGTHWGCTTFLTSANIRRTPGRAFHNNISCDQIAAKLIGSTNRFPSIQLTASNDDHAGMGPGLSMAWDERGNPIPAIDDPLVFYSNLFGDGGLTEEQFRRKLALDRSALDIVQDDAKSVINKINKEDKEKVEEYFNLVRSLEKQFKREEEWRHIPKPQATTKQPNAGLSGTAEVMANMDLIAAALQTDSTRIITYRLPIKAWLNEYLQQFGGSVAPHHMTHYANKETHEYKALRWREEKCSEAFAALTRKLKSIKESDGTSLLDNTIIVMGSDIRTVHQKQNLPILMAGGSAMGVRQGRHLVCKKSKTPLSNLWLSMLNHVGCNVNSFADSTEPLNLG